MFISENEVNNAKIVGIKASYLNIKEINYPEEMPRTVTTLPMDDEWINRIQCEWWYHRNRFIDGEKNNEVIDEQLFVLRDRLLSFGGQEVCLPVVEEDLKKIMERGQLWYGDRLRLLHGETGQCHQNASSYWNANMSKTVLCTGYALSEDSMWRQHSWLVELRARRNRIIETTVPKVLYFGFPMTKMEAETFYLKNI